MNISPAAVYGRTKYQFLTKVAENRVVTGQLADKPTRGLVNSRTSHHHHHQTPWDQRPLVSTARFTRILHPALSTASPANE